MLWQLDQLWQLECKRRGWLELRVTEVLKLEFLGALSERRSILLPTPMVSVSLGMVPQSWCRDIQRVSFRSTKGKILGWSFDDFVIPYGKFGSTPSSGGAGWRFVGDTTNFMKQRWVSWIRSGIVSTVVDTFERLETSGSSSGRWNNLGKTARDPWRGAAKYRVKRTNRYS